MVYVERPKLHNQGKGETSMRKLLSAAVHASAQALETSVNLLESATGLDIDGDGDVGLAGSGNTPRKDRPPDAEPGAPASSARESKSSGLSGLRLFSSSTPKGLKYDEAVPEPTNLSLAGPSPAAATPRSAHAQMESGGRLGRVSYMPTVKLLDFGVSQVCVDAVDAGGPDGEKVHEKKRFDDSILKATGTPLFFSPEMCHLPPIPFHGRPADVWAAGVTLCMLVSGELPFTGDNMPEIWRKVQEEPPELDTVLPKQCTQQLRDILSLMLSKDPNKRPTAKQLREHPWVTRGGEEPMPEQPYLPLEITDDDIKQAVQHFSDTFTLLKAGQKWKKKVATRKREARGDAEAVAVPEAITAPSGEAAPETSSEEAPQPSPKRKPSMVERQLTTKLDVNVEAATGDRI